MSCWRLIKVFQINYKYFWLAFHKWAAFFRFLKSVLRLKRYRDISPATNENTPPIQSLKRGQIRNRNPKFQQKISFFCFLAVAAAFFFYPSSSIDFILIFFLVIRAFLPAFFPFIAPRRFVIKFTHNTRFLPRRRRFAFRHPFRRFRYHTRASDRSIPNNNQSS